MTKWIRVSLCIVAVLHLTGCWSRREPKTLALISSALYDIQDDGTYKATLEIINPEAQGGPQGTGGDKSPVLTVTGEGMSLPEALRKTSESLERSLFAGQTLARFYTEKYAKKDVFKDQDYFFRDSLTDENPLVIVIRGEKSELLYTATLGLSNTVGNYITDLHRTQDNFISTAVFIDSLIFLKDYHTEGKQPVAGAAEIVEDNTRSSNNADEDGKKTGQESSGAGEKKYKIKYEGLAAFKDEKLAGYLSGTEARAYKILTNTVGNSIISLTDDSDTSVIRIDKSKASITASPAKDKDEIRLEAKVKMDVSLIQAGEDIDATSFDDLKYLEDRFNRYIKGEIETAVKKAQKDFKSDIFGFGRGMHINDPKEWKKYKNNWDESFAGADISIEVESSISKTGHIKKTIKNKA